LNQLQGNDLTSEKILRLTNVACFSRSKMLKDLITPGEDISHRDGQLWQGVGAGFGSHRNRMADNNLAGEESSPRHSPKQQAY
jgi:hypothetical protein